MNVTSSVPVMFPNLEEIVFESYIFPAAVEPVVDGDMILPCIHVLCRSCVATVSSRTGRKVKDKLICVVCQLEFEISSVDVLRKRKTVTELLLEFSKAANDMKPLCERDSCWPMWNEVNRRSASTYCIMCKKHSCFQCEDSHRNNYHSCSVVERSHWTEKPPNFKFCANHKSHIKQLEVFCIVCCKVDCFIRLVENFPSDINELDKTLADEIQSLSEIVEEVRAVKTELEKQIIQLESWKRETEARIKRKYKELTKTVEKQKDFILDELNSFSSQVLKELEQKMEKQGRHWNSLMTEHGPQLEASFEGQIREIESHMNSVLIQLKLVNIERKEELERRRSIIDTVLQTMDKYMKSCVSMKSVGNAEEKFCAVGVILKKAEELKRELQHFSATSNESSDLEKSFKAEYQWKNQGQSHCTDAVADIHRKKAGTTDTMTHFRQSESQDPSSSSVRDDVSRERSKNASATFEMLASGGQNNYEDQTRYRQGLVNFGNTCYFNAVIQCLCQTFPLLEELSLRTTISKQPLTESFVGFWKHRIKDSPEQSNAFSAFFQELYTSSPKFNNCRQHDSHDLFIHFLNDLRSEERLQTPQYVDPKKVLTTVDKVFGGHFITMYACLKCDQPYFVCECLLDISLPIRIPQQHQQQHQQHPYSGRGTGEEDQASSERDRGSTVDRQLHQLDQTSYNDKGKKRLTRGFLKALNEDQRISRDVGERYDTRPVALTECLRFYTATEHIPADYLCLSCQDKDQTAASAKAQIMSSAMKRTLIYNPPAVLVLHLKRFERTTTGFTKRSDIVSYEELLDLGPYCNSDCLRIDADDKNVWYSLYGVVVHSGSLDCGHYIAYVKVGESNSKVTKTFLQQEFLERDQVVIEQHIKLTGQGKRAEEKVEWQPKPTTEEGRWVHVSDSYTRNATLHEALNQEAFMLFYERVPKRDQ